MSDYEQFLALAQSRRSVRKFSNRPVARDDLRRVLEAARWAPSNHNRQPWKFLVLEDRAKIAALAETVKRELAGRLGSLPPAASGFAGEFAHYATFFAGAPVLILALHKRPASFSHELLRETASPELISGEPLSVAMAVQNLLLAAHALGLGACMLTAPLIVRDAVVREVALPPGHEVTCLVALGHPAEAPAQTRRKSIEQIADFVNDGGGWESK